MGGPQGGTDASALERSPRVGRPAPREVDEIGLADRLGGRLVAGLLAVPDQEWLDLRPEASEMFRAEIGPAPEDRLAVGRRCRRQDDDPWTRAFDRGEEIAVEGRHPRQELTGADQRHGPGHGGESSACQGSLRGADTLPPSPPPPRPPPRP